MGNSNHILVVDDDLGLRELLDRYFAGNGYRVTTVANGRQMREVLANHRVDLIVLDLMLPGMTASRSAATCAQTSPMTFRS